MNKREWLESLERDQRNRTGLGMYVLDSFNEEIAGLLAEHDRELVQSVLNSIEFNMPHDICSGEEAIAEIRYAVGTFENSEEDLEEER